MPKKGGVGRGCKGRRSVGRLGGFGVGRREGGAGESGGLVC